LWKISRELVRQVYSDFPGCKDYAFSEQIKKAGISIMNNISEGFCRRTDIEFRQFLNISKGSAGELKSMYYVAEDLKYIEPNLASDLRDKCQQIMNSLGGFMKYLNKR
jgi:four helix bundle protein